MYLAELRPDSWSLTLLQLKRTLQQGGINLPQRRTFLLWQHTSAFVSFVHQPEMFRGAVGEHFRTSAASHGVVVTPQMLPRFQMAVVPVGNLPFLASSASQKHENGQNA